MKREAVVSNGWPATILLPRRLATLALCLGLTGTLAHALASTPVMAAQGAILSFGLAWASMVDVDRFILPDVLTVGLGLAGLGFALGGGPQAFLPHLIGAAAGYLALGLVALVYQRLRGQSGLGMGDAKLLAAGGAWLGWTALPSVVLIASVSCLALLAGQALLRGERMPRGPVPFGPYLAGAIWLMWLLHAGGVA
jgi:leader peptidase (prepilin peptidase)/N-methyltransferase